TVMSDSDESGVTYTEISSPFEGLSDIGSPGVVGPECDNHDLSRFDNQSIERDHLIGIGFVLDFVEFISFTFSDKEIILVI
ncbi:hypothetical protein Tco_1338304, partial [Tanacetum coccineum]